MMMILCIILCTYCIIIHYVYISYTRIVVYIYHIYVLYMYIYVCVLWCWLLFVIFMFHICICVFRTLNKLSCSSCINHDENRPPSPRQHLMHLRLGIPTHQVVPRIGNLVKPTPRVPLPHSKIPTGSASCTNAPTMPAISSVVKMRTIPLLDSRISRYGNHWDHVTAPLS